MIRLTRANVVLEYSAFETLRRALLAAAPRGGLDQPLAVWAQPCDSALPLALMDKPLATILTTPFEDLYNARGIGPKKINCLLELLRRAADQSPPCDAPPPSEVADHPSSTAAEPNHADAAITAAMWDEWRLAVLRHGYGPFNLGRFARSLHDLPSVVWDAPLENYARLSLDEVRRLHAFGDKRINALLEIFATLHALLEPGGTPNHLAVVVVPALASLLDQWVAQCARSPRMPDDEDTRVNFLQPIIGQLDIDGGRELSLMAHVYLGLDLPPQEDGPAAQPLVARPGSYHRRKMRAIVRARWPEGEQHVRPLMVRCQLEDHVSAEVPLLVRAGQLFFPATTSTQVFVPYPVSA